MYDVKLSNIKVEHHRNGVAGEPFHVATFDAQEDNEHRKMVGVLFSSQGSCAVFDLELLAKGNIEFGVNSWRGDVYESQLRAAIEDYHTEKKSDIILEGLN